MVKGAIALLKKRNPNTKARAAERCGMHPLCCRPACSQPLRPGSMQVLISVGGATYTGWDNLNVRAIAQFVEAFGLDGADVDYEGGAVCQKGANGRMSCTSDDM